MQENELSILGRIGQGPPPGYQWNVLSEDHVLGELRKLTNEHERSHLKDVMEQLASESDPRRSQLCDVKRFKEYFELRDKGGPLGNKNVRVFFMVVDSKRAIIILGVILKQNNGKTPPGAMVGIERRFNLIQSSLKG